MPKIIVVLAAAFALLGPASPAAAGPGAPDVASCAGPDAGCRPAPENPRIPLTQLFAVPAGLAGTAIASCDAQHQFTHRGIGYPYRAADPAITGDIGIVTGGPYPYRASAESTGRVGGYPDAFYWRINNSTRGPANLVMSITCQKPPGF